MITCQECVGGQATSQPPREENRKESCAASQASEYFFTSQFHSKGSTFEEGPLDEIGKQRWNSYMTLWYPSDTPLCSRPMILQESFLEHNESCDSPHQFGPQIPVPNLREAVGGTPP